MTIDEAEKIKTVVENRDYIVQLVNTVVKTMIEAFENLKIEDVNMFQLGYNKAVDDFAEWLVKQEIVDEDSMPEIIMDFNEEQLKAGEQNENTNQKESR